MASHLRIRSIDNRTKNDEQVHSIEQTRAERIPESYKSKDRHHHHHHHHRREQRKPSSSSSSHVSQNSVDAILKNQNNDWFFEKLLAKFESLRGESSHHYDRSSSPYPDDIPAERIVERRYYVKKSKPLSKSNQLTSTSDLVHYHHRHHHRERRHRQQSGISSMTETSISSCSGCSSSASTPSYVEHLREQSESLKDEIRNLKAEIKNLYTSQEKFFAQFKTQLHSTAESTNSSQILARSVIPAIPKKSPSPSTSESDHAEESESVVTSRNTTPVSQPVVKSIATPSNTSVNALPPITEFTGFRHSSMNSTPPIIPSNKPIIPSVVSTPPVSEFMASKHSSIAPTPTTIVQQQPRIPSVISNRTASEFAASRYSSAAPTPPVTQNQFSNALPIGQAKPSLNLRRESVTSQETQSESIPSVPNNGNAIHSRRVLSPRSQIVASSGGYQTDGSEDSSGSSSPSQQEPVKTPPLSLGAIDMQNLVQYSSQLESSGYRPLVKHVIPDPNRSTMFWESVDQYIQINGNLIPTSNLSKIPQTQNNSLIQRYPQSHRQLDKYDLEIRGQEFIESSAPLLLPPLDISP